MIAVLPSMIHPKTAVLGRAGGVNCKTLFIGYDATLYSEERRVAA